MLSSPAGKCRRKRPWSGGPRSRSSAEHRERARRRLTDTVPARGGCGRRAGACLRSDSACRARRSTARWSGLSRRMSSPLLSKNRVGPRSVSTSHSEGSTSVDTLTIRRRWGTNSRRASSSSKTCRTAGGMLARSSTNTSSRPSASQIEIQCCGSAIGNARTGSTPLCRRPVLSISTSRPQESWLRPKAPPAAIVGFSFSFAMSRSSECCAIAGRGQRASCRRVCTV